MGEVVIFRQYNMMWPFNVWTVYANNKKIGRIRNAKSITVELPDGEYTFQVKYNGFLKRVYSNTIMAIVSNEENVLLDVRFHPLCFLTYIPKYFKAEKALELSNMRENFALKLDELETEKNKGTEYIESIHLHKSTWVLTIISSLLLIITNIAYPDAFFNRNAWGLLFGFINITGLFFNRHSRYLLLKGYERWKHIVISVELILSPFLFIKSSYHYMVALFFVFGFTHLILGISFYNKKEKFFPSDNPSHNIKQG